MDNVYSILIAEDDALMRGALMEALAADKRIAVTAFDNGQDALTFALEKHPALLVLDIAMPGLDGITVLRKLRADEWGKSARVILLTSLGSSEVVMREVTQLDPAYCLTKDQTSINEVIEKAYHLLDITK